MKWLSKILGGRGEHQPGDPIIARCWAIAREYGLSLNDEEWDHVWSNRDKLAASPLGGAFVHRDVVHVLCFLCLFDGVFETGVELLQAGAYHRAIDTLEKARKLLPWPIVLYSLVMAYACSGNSEAATRFRNAALDGFGSRTTLLLTIVPTSLPDRDNFLRMTAERLDTTGSLALGFAGMAELRDAMSQRTW